MKEKKYPIYYHIIALALPVVFFVVLELGLRLVGYGQTIPQWIHPSDHFSDYIVLNQDITKKYFHNIKARPSPTYDGFFETKQPGTFRVFVMGGSTTAGFPFTINGSFARYIRHFLETAYPKQNIEVINLGISAVNSYTVRDLIPGVIEKEPDLVIFYMGHNEYYGAYGVGSAESLGTIRWMVNSMIALEDYRTIQLLRNLISGVTGRSPQTSPSQKQETLMARMVGEKLIPSDSDIYHKGIRQFEGNFSDILEMLQAHEIPVILSRLTTNVKDQPPFESVRIDDQPLASTVFNEAKDQYSAENYTVAKDLYLKAKDLDALRFRGPEALNQIIDSVGREFNLPVVLMDSVFNDLSPNGIPGNNLFTDHVHPTMAGYRKMGAAFADMMIKTGNLPRFPAQVTIKAAHQAASSGMTLTYLDSVVADLRIRNLKGGWPFLKGKIRNMALQNYQPANPIQALALGMVLKKLNWEEAHLQAALWYRNNDQPDAFFLEMRAILENVPLNPQPFKVLIDGLVQYQRIEDAYPYLLELDKRLPDAYSKKWLGIYYLYKQSYKKALGYLLQSAQLNDQDPQLLYNLSGAHFHNGQHKEALQTIQKCLNHDNNFPGARRMEQDLLRLLN